MLLSDNIAEQDALQAALMSRIKANHQKVMSSVADKSDISAILAQIGGVAGPAPAVAKAPTGGAMPTGNVAQWINQALKVLHLDSSYAPGIAKMIQKESSGNPNAINNWDSNAKAGHPSQGLMQTIPSTFKAYALPGYNSSITDPVSNIIAGVRYAQNRYGSDMLKSGGRKNAAGNYIGY